MNQNNNSPVTKKYVDLKFEQVDLKFEQVDKRFEQVDKRFEQVNQRFEQVDNTLDKLDGKFDQMMNTLVQIVADIETMREDQTLALGKDKEFEFRIEDHDNRIKNLEKITHPS